MLLRRCIVSTTKTPRRPNRASAGPTGRKIAVGFSEELLSQVEQIAEEQSSNRCDIIRLALETYVRLQQENRLERALIEGYTANSELARTTAEDFALMESELA